MVKGCDILWVADSCNFSREDQGVFESTSLAVGFKLASAIKYPGIVKRRTVEYRFLLMPKGLHSRHQRVRRGVMFSISVTYYLLGIETLQATWQLLCFIAIKDSFRAE